MFAFLNVSFISYKTKKDKHFSKDISFCDHLAYFDRLFFFCVCFSYAYVHVAVAVCECWLKRLCVCLFVSLLLTCPLVKLQSMLCLPSFVSYICQKRVCVCVCVSIIFLFFMFLLILKMCKLGAKTCYDYYVWVYLFNLGGYLVWLVLFSNWCFFFFMYIQHCEVCKFFTCQCVLWLILFVFFFVCFLMSVLCFDFFSTGCFHQFSV